MRFLSANRVFNGKNFLPDGTVLVLDEKDRLAEFVTEDKIENNRIEKLEGILTPGFVNSHCHLELSHLKGLIPMHTGLPEFARQVIVSRNEQSAPAKAERMQQADRDMWNRGIVAVGDISNGPESFAQKAGSNIFYHTFIELIGLKPENAALVFEKGLGLFQELSHLQLRGSLAPHAPYSTSRELIQMIALHDGSHQLPLSIHNQESPEETKFFAGQQNDFEKLYRFLGLDTSWFKAPGVSSLQYYARALAQNTPSILVHNTFTAPADIKAASEKSIYWCFCPAANLYIEAALPDFTFFKGLEERICLGTDSLASNSQLDLISEANEICRAHTPFSTESLLRAITYNGARALGISDNFGQLHLQKNAGLNLVGIQNSELQFLKKIS